MGSFAIVACVLVALLGCVGAESSVGLGPLEFGKFSPPEDKFHVKASAAGPGSRELSAAAVSGDAMFIFGGQDDEGYQDALYAFGTNASGALGWTFLHGNATNSVGRYGARKSMSADDYPSARAGACMGFITSSHSILFGGRGIDAEGEEGFLNDLWIAEDMTHWGWYAGSKTRNGKAKLSGKDATPSARWKHTCGPHFESKRFIMFGGMGEHPERKGDTAILDDLFAYGEDGWEFLGGGSHSQVPDFNNKNPELRNPGSRAEHASVMVEDMFYTFGGQSINVDSDRSLTEVMMADLWQYDLNKKLWTYVAGSHLANTHAAFPKSIGQGGVGMGPGARVSASMAFNQLTNEIYIFGGFGYGYVPGEVGYLNDLWSYNTVDKNFYWLGGSAGLNSNGADTPPLAPSARSSALLFSGNDGLEQELTLIGGTGPETKDKAEGIAEVWMVNVQVPPGFTIKAPHTTMPPTTTEEPTTRTKATTEKEATERPHDSESHSANNHGDNDEGHHHEEQQHHDEEEEEEHHHSKPTKPVVTMSTRSTLSDTETRTHRAQNEQSLFDAGSPQKIAALVLGSFVAIILLVAGITVLGFSIVGSSNASGGSRNVLEPYTSV